MNILITILMIELNGKNFSDGINDFHRFKFNLCGCVCVYFGDIYPD